MFINGWTWTAIICKYTSDYSWFVCVFVGVLCHITAALKVSICCLSASRSTPCHSPLASFIYDAFCPTNCLCHWEVLFLFSLCCRLKRNCSSVIADWIHCVCVMITPYSNHSNLQLNIIWASQLYLAALCRIYSSLSMGTKAVCIKARYVGRVCCFFFFRDVEIYGEEKQRNSLRANRINIGQFHRS